MAKTRVSISHHNHPVVHTYVQGNAIVPYIPEIPILEEIQTANLKVNRLTFSAVKSRSGRGEAIRTAAKGTLLTSFTGKPGWLHGRQYR